MHVVKYVQKYCHDDHIPKRLILSTNEVCSDTHKQTRIYTRNPG